MKYFVFPALFAVSAAFASAAFANEITPSDPFVSTADREHVKAEFLRFRTQPNPWSFAYNPFTGFKSQRERADVRAEYLAARDEVAAFNGEDSGSFALAQIKVVDTRFAGLRDGRQTAQWQEGRRGRGQARSAAITILSARDVWRRLV